MAVMKLQDGQSGLPSTRSTSSFWHSEPSKNLIGHRTTTDIPVEADVVVVGSGITGSFVARELVLGGRGVVLLEAREACWGATGRNGGHCQPVVYMRQPHIARFELATYNFLKDLITEHGIPCSWKTVGGVHGITSLDVLALAKKRVAYLQSHHPDLASTLRLVTDRGELEGLRLSDDAVGAVVQDCAAKCWPYKLVAWVLEGLLDNPLFNLQTTTNVFRLQKLEKQWMVHTDRGQIAASQVVLATNAYTSYLLPEFTELIRPTRGQVIALRPAEGVPVLEHSHLWTVRREGDVAESEDYLIQRDTGELILGGERMCTADSGEGVSSDDEVDPVVGDRLRRALRRSLSQFPEMMEAAYEWTGIMGFSADGSPWVGKIPETLGGGEGLWISAAYTGHGMPVAARAGVAVAEKVMGKENGIEIPEEWAPTKERVKRAKKLTMPQSLEEEYLSILKSQDF